MGLEQCASHGRQPGPLCCVHVQGAAHGTGDVPPVETIQFQVDLTDDGAHLLPHIVCASCASQFGLTAGSRVAGEIAERSGAFPWVAPTCQVCVESWLNSPASQGGDA
jgi:hypothetical protein